MRKLELLKKRKKSTTNVPEEEKEQGGPQAIEEPQQVFTEALREPKVIIKHNNSLKRQRSQPQMNVTTTNFPKREKPVSIKEPLMPSVYQMQIPQRVQLVQFMHDSFDIRGRTNSMATLNENIVKEKIRLMTSQMTNEKRRQLTSRDGLGSQTSQQSTDRNGSESK